MAKDLLLEIGTEELPPNAVDVGIKQLKEKAKLYFKRERLSYSALEAWGTPRRLILKVSKLASRQDKIISEIKGPAKHLAYTDAGEPTVAAIGFAKSCSINVKSLKVKSIPQGTYVFAVKSEEGKAASLVLKESLGNFIFSPSFSKTMHWGEKLDGEGEIYFPRPIRWLLVLYGSEVIPLRLGRLKASNLSFGHRFLNKSLIKVESSRTYSSSMRKGKVIFDQVLRKKLIEEQVALETAKAKGAPIISPHVLSSVVQLVECPVVTHGIFSKDFLKLPKDVLITVMEHQFYFPVKDKQGGLAPLFLVVHNGDSRYNRKIVRGHERVLKARLDDAKFFYDEDKKVPLEKLVEKLKGVVFQEKLGSLYDRTKRVRALAKKIATELKLNKPTLSKVERAAYLSKTDLVTQMVTEFPELQGVMGKEYAFLFGEDKKVAEALFEQYLPKGMKGPLPKTTVGAIVSLANKLDTIFSCLAARLLPTGSEDPYGLRREAASSLRIILERNMKLSLNILANFSLKELQKKGLSSASSVKTIELIENLLKERLASYLVKKDKIKYDVLDAVFLSVRPDDVSDIRERVKAIEAIRETRTMDNILTSFTRCKNLSQPSAGSRVNSKFLQEKDEKKLYEILVKREKELQSVLKSGNYKEGLKLLGSLRPYVDAFFDEVLVMAEDVRLRKNRLALLNTCIELFLKVADFSKIVVPGQS